MSVCDLHNHWNQEWEGHGLVAFQNGEEVVVFKKAHGPVGNLQMRSWNAPDQSFKKLVDHRL